MLVTVIDTVLVAHRSLEMAYVLAAKFVHENVEPDTEFAVLPASFSV